MSQQPGPPPGMPSGANSAEQARQAAALHGAARIAPALAAAGVKNLKPEYSGASLSIAGWFSGLIPKNNHVNSGASFSPLGLKGSPLMAKEGKSTGDSGGMNV